MIDSFDQRVLDETGNAQEIFSRLYGKDLSKATASNYLSAIRHHLRFKQKMAEAGRSMNDMEEVEIKAGGGRTTRRMMMLSESDALEPRKVMTLMGFDPLQWELVNCKTKRAYWDVTMKFGNASAGYFPQKETNHAYTVELTVKPIQQILSSEYVREVFKGLKPLKPRVLHHTPGDYLLELPILDFHLGKLAWKPETGEDYDMRIAADRWMAVIGEIISRVSFYRLPIEKIIFPIGQDFFHMDTTKSTTTSGTQLDSDTRWQKMYQRGIELLVWAVNQLVEVAPVECMWVGGNHDEMLSYTATCHVDAYFRLFDAVTVNTSPAPRKYFEWGKCAIGMSHGEKEGKRIFGLMQIEAPEMWGRTKYREMHLGHLHKEGIETDTIEENGIIVRHIAAICGRDAWTAGKGWLSIKKAQAFVWDKEKGNILTITATV